MIKNNYLQISFVFWLILYSLLHFPAFKVDIQHMHSYRQAMTQNNIRNFTNEDFNIFRPRRDNRGATNGVFRMEFPVMQWLFGGVHRILDSDDIRITRFLTFLLGILSTIGIFFFLSTIFRDKIIACIGAWFFSFSPTFYYFTVCPMPDNFALCSGIWGLVIFLFWTQSKRTSILLFSGFLLALSTAAKLPFLLYCAFPLGWFLSDFLGDKRYLISNLKSVFQLFFLQVFAIVWYIIVIPTWGENPIVKGWFADEGNVYRGLDYFQHHLISTLPENLVNFGVLRQFFIIIWIEKVGVFQTII